MNCPIYPENSDRNIKVNVSSVKLIFFLQLDGIFFNLLSRTLSSASLPKTNPILRNAISPYLYE